MSNTNRKWPNFNLYVGDGTVLEKADAVAGILCKDETSKSKMINAVLHPVFDAVIAGDFTFVEGGVEVEVKIAI